MILNKSYVVFIYMFYVICTYYIWYSIYIFLYRLTIWILLKKQWEKKPHPKNNLVQNKIVVEFQMNMIITYQ